MNVKISLIAIIYLIQIRNLAVDQWQGEIDGIKKGTDISPLIIGEVHKNNKVISRL